MPYTAERISELKDIIKQHVGVGKGHDKRNGLFIKLLASLLIMATLRLTMLLQHTFDKFEFEEPSSNFDNSYTKAVFHVGVDKTGTTSIQSISEIFEK